MRKRLIIALIFFLFFSTYQIQDNFRINFPQNIEKIIIENNQISETEKIKNSLVFLYETNIFYLNTKDIKTNLEKFEFIDSFEIRKKFPNQIKIKIFEKKPIAIIQNKRNKKYYTNKGEVINFKKLKEFKDLPLVFGDEKNFGKFYRRLKNTNFPLNEIKRFYLFESKRWDLVTKKNQTIKLPNIGYEKSLKNFMDIKDQLNFEKYKTFDYRITNQLILK
tara:strand:- start:11653 stop:12312 length:660 start_codon:yes stop_codon:yes gene_type:complete